MLGVSGNYLYMIERGVHAPSRPLADRFEELVRGLSFFTAPEVARRIPILSWVQAGRSTNHEEMPEGDLGWIDCLCPDPKAFGLRVVGDSMLYKYPPGGLVICMPSYTPKTGGLAVAKFRDESTTFKKVTFRGDTPASFRFIPLNKDFPAVSALRAEVVWIYPVHSVIGRR